MKLTVLGDKKGDVVGVMFHPGNQPPDPAKDAQGARLVAGEGQTIAIVDPPRELAGREPNADYLDALRGYSVRAGKLVKKAAK